MMAAIERAECPSKSSVTSQLDKAAAIIWTNTTTALTEPAILGMGCRAPATVFGEIRPNDNATPTITSRTRPIESLAASAIIVRQVASTVERVRPIVISRTGDAPQLLKR